ncbi:MAG: hypothetical protein KF723_10845 [Rhizobiaceae bacterium]|nr:hypothetical protein [Rhizobiaceae bacterium]
MLIDALPVDLEAADLEPAFDAAIPDFAALDLAPAFAPDLAAVLDDADFAVLVDDAPAAADFGTGFLAMV